MAFAERLKIARKENKLTQAAVAKCLGIAEGSYCAYEKGKREPDVEKIRKLANIFNVSADFLINTNKYNKDAVLNETEKNLLKKFKEDEGIELYIKLDEIDQAEIRGEMKQMLKDEKYNNSKSKETIA